MSLTTASLMLQLLKPVEVERVKLTPEQEAEYTARSKEYSRRMMREHRIWQSDLATKLRLKKVQHILRDSVHVWLDGLQPSFAREHPSTAYPVRTGSVEGLQFAHGRVICA